MSEDKISCRFTKVKNNKLLSRVQMIVDVFHSPQVKVTKNMIMEEVKKKFKKNHISIFGLKKLYGGGRTKAFALVYDSEDAMKKIEPPSRIRKMELEKLPPAERKAAGKPKKKEILRPEHVKKLFEVPWDNNMCRLANLLAMYTGMRASEVQALRVCDIHENYIWISHGWDDHIGLKTPKNGEERPVPISKELRESLLNMATFNPRYTKDKENSFVFFGITGEKPVSQRGFNKFLQRALGESGYPEPKKIGFHCWRHGFCTQAQTVVHDDRMIREVSGHKSAEVFNHCADHLEMMDTINTMGNVAQQLFGDIVAKTLRNPVWENADVTA